LVGVDEIHVWPERNRLDRERAHPIPGTLGVNPVHPPFLGKTYASISGARQKKATSRAEYVLIASRVTIQSRVRATMADGRRVLQLRIADVRG
jgi:hypothetical protein